MRIALAAAVFLAACTKPPAPADQLHDARGKPFTPMPRARIVSLAPHTTEILAALGAADHLVAVDAWSDYPPAVTALPHLTGLAPSLETVVHYKPDLVVLPDSIPEVTAKLDQAGIAAFVCDANRLASLFTTLRELGRLLGHEAEAARVAAALTARIDAVRARTGARPPVTVFVALDLDDPHAPWTAGRGTFIDEVVTLAGGRNVAAAAPGSWLRYSLEALLRADPDWIVLSTIEQVTPAEALTRLRGYEGWNRLTAVKEGRLIVIDPAYIARPSPRIVDGLERLADTFGAER
jgi:iron complex transport system substrate-binding protein